MSTVELPVGSRVERPVAAVDRAGNRVRYDRDGGGRITGVHSVELDRAIETRTYRPDGRLATATDGAGATTSYDYDDLGRLVTVVPPGPRGPHRYEYDERSHVSAVTYGNGTRIDFRRDDAGRTTAIAHGGDVLAEFAYDADGNLVHRSGSGWSQSTKWDAGRPVESVRTEAGQEERVEYAHDADGRLTAHADAAGTTSYRHADGLITVADPFGGTTVLAHDDQGRRTTTTFVGAGTQSVRFDDEGRPVELRVTDPDGATVFAVDYDYGGGALLRSRTIDGVTTDYDYDALGRLVRAGEVEYRYDQANNLVHAGPVSFEVNAAGQHVRFGETILAYDGAGNFFDEVNPTGEFTYSPTNQTRTGVFGGVQVVDITYDGADHREPRRIQETTVDGRTVVHVLHRTILGITRVTDDGAATDFVRDPDGRLLGLRTPDGTRHHAITDHQGTVLALLGTDGTLTATYTYSAFGAVTATTGEAAANPFRYLGAYQLLRGAHFFECRLYNGFWGRFTQPDPRNQARAPYTFADNDPVNLGNPARTNFWATLTRPEDDLLAAFHGHPADPTPFDGTGIPAITHHTTGGTA